MHWDLSVVIAGALPGITLFLITQDPNFFWFKPNLLANRAKTPPPGPRLSFKGLKTNATSCLANLKGEFFLGKKRKSFSGPYRLQYFRGESRNPADREP